MPSTSLRTSLIAAGALAALTGAAALDLFAQERPTGQKYKLEAVMLIVDNCNVICPCLFGNAPTHGHCRNVSTVELKGGELGGVSLAGAKWAMLGEFSGETRKGPTWGYHAFYIDSEAAPEQKAALRAILGAPPFSQLGDMLGIEEVPIEFVHPADPLGAWTARIGDKGAFTAQPIAGNDRKSPQAVENPVYPFPAKKIVLASAAGRFEDHGKELQLDANSGEISEWSLEGEIPAGTAPAGMKR
jgi:hypothetical protein